ncbi:MAG: hypothetical protein JEY71_16375 [Sphaerochaeta sp.]|nr:hypothetical protein [Sphaerochaeta sp.]
MPPFPPQGAGYLTLLSRHSLGNGSMLPLLSLRWGINGVIRNRGFDFIKPYHDRL